MRSRICQDVVLLVGLMLVSRSVRAAEPPAYRFDTLALRGARVTQERRRRGGGTSIAAGR